MSESHTHAALVQQLASWMAENYFQGDRGRLFIDSPFCDRHTRPPIIGEFVPDVFAETNLPRHILIGEAKTKNDIENLHTKQQLESFLKYCSTVNGSQLIMAVPWHMTRCVRSMINIIITKNNLKNINYIVLDALKG